MNNSQEELSDTTAPKPHLTPNGNLIIPCYADAKYRHWQEGGQSLLATLRELNAPPGVLCWYQRDLDVEMVQGKAAG